MKTLLLYIYMVCLVPCVLFASPAKTATDYYNEGNACYRNHDMGGAVLAYERALRLNPADDDAAYNLSHVRTLLSDRFASQPEMFFVSWTKQIVFGQNSGTWLARSLLFIALVLALWLVFRHSQKPRIKKIAFFTCAISLLFLLFTLSSAMATAWRFANEHRAVVVRTTPARTRSSRTEAPKRQLHAGTTLILTGVITPDSLAAAQLPDGTESWIQTEDIETVEQ